MAKPPPVPPKDPGYTARMDKSGPLTAPTSGSKRKREPDDDAYAFQNSHSELSDSDQHSPKRSRPQSRQSHESPSRDIAGQGRLVRRKKGSMNLSNLNLRHAAETQALQKTITRGSKFQEHSLTDKPIAEPPSVYTRTVRTQSGSVEYVDDLMSDYHDGIMTPRDSIEEIVAREKELIPQRVAELNAAEVNKSEGKGFFKFGRQLTANFHPVALWNKIWGETKEELTRQNIEEAERKARQKAEAEAKYAQMKRDGLLGLQPVGKLVNGARSTGEGSETPRDSAIVIDGLHTAFDDPRSASVASQLMPPTEEVNSRSGSEVPESSGKAISTIKSRLHLKKPSLSNIKNDLKRVRSDWTIGATAANRESSSSLSPVKALFDTSTLKQSASKADLKKHKKQQELSQRVSNLESKLQLARSELAEAIDEASPMPKLTGRYERFTGGGTLKRPKFFPGKLPSLPSERILNAQQALGVNEKVLVNGEASEREETTGVSLKDFLAEREEGDGEDTIKASRARHYPRRASSLFNLDDDNNITRQSSINGHQDYDTKTSGKLDTETSQLTELSSEAIENMDPNSINELNSDATPQPTKPADYASLDAKLKGLDANVKTARKAAKPKKRKSTGADVDKPYRPDGDSDDDAEWAEFTPKKKKRKSESSPPNKAISIPAQSSPVSKKGKSGSPKSTAKGSPLVSKKSAAKTSAGQPTEVVEEQPREEEYTADELADESDALRTSVDNQSLALEPVYEEEEETSTIPLKDAPSKPTAKATPARYGHHSLRSRSHSPYKRTGSAEPGVEEQMMTRAAIAAQKHPSRRRGRSASPPPSIGFSMTSVESETVSIIPGAEGVPSLPKGANGSFESLAEFEKEMTEVEVIGSARNSGQFEWPEDVF